MTQDLNKSILKIITALAIIISFAYLMFPFVSAIIMGGILSLALHSTMVYLRSKGLSTKAALNYLMGGIFFVLLAPSLAFLIRGSGVLTRTINDPQNVEKFNQLVNQANSYLEKVSPTFGISPEELHTYINQGVQKISGFTLNIFSQVMAGVPNLILFSIIFLLSIYFFLTQEDHIRKLFDRYFYFTPAKSDHFITVLQSCSREIFLSNVLTGLIQSSLVTIGAVIFGYAEWFLIFFITFICSFIPIIGAGPIALILALTSFANGSVGAGIGMLVVSAVSGTADNIVRPYLVSRGTVEVPGIISFLAVIGGVITMGLPGLFLGPLIASMVFGVLPMLINEFLPEKNSNQ